MSCRAARSCRCSEAQTPNGWREDFYYHFYTGYGIPEHYGLLTKDHKLMHFPGFGDGNYWELFDLTNDPDELTNIYGQKSCMAITAELHKQLTQLRHELKAE